jgi:hypothetical protein
MATYDEKVLKDNYVIFEVIGITKSDDRADNENEYVITLKNNENQTFWCIIKPDNSVNDNKKNGVIFIKDKTGFTKNITLFDRHRTFEPDEIMGKYYYGFKIDKTQRGGRSRHQTAFRQRKPKRAATRRRRV